MLLGGLGYLALTGMAVAAVSGFIAIKIVRRTLLAGRFYLFSVYCLLIGLAALLL